MSGLAGLDLGGLAKFRASDLLADEQQPSDAGKPLQVALALIDFDPAQPRRSFGDASVDELAVSIEMHGVLEPVSLRTHPDVADRFIVNRGERRVRAARRAGLDHVPAFLDEKVDPFAQAAENLHRESMSPFDLATFISEREREGLSRAEIARRLNKSRSFITEAASLIDAPATLKLAFDSGRLGGDARTLYRLIQVSRKRPAQATALLAGEGLITRSSLDLYLAQDHAEEPGPSSLPAPAVNTAGAKRPSTGRTVLVVDHAGRRGSLRMKAHDKDLAEVRFGDGSRNLVNMKELRLVCWAAEE